MARRPAGRTDKPWIALMVALALGVGLLIWLSGRAEEPAEQEAIAPPPAEMVDGYAYTAMLMSRHPLWGSLRDLEDALEELGDEEWDPPLPPVEDRFEDIALIESYALGDPEPRITDLRANWRANYPPLRLPADGLAEDLQARISWEAEQAERMVQRRMARARAAESRRLAQLRASLVEKYQERLTNLSIQAEVRQDEAADAAVRERERVWQVIEAEVEATREACERQLAELEATLREDAAGRVAQARERAGQISAQREGTMQAAGAELYDEMIAQMQGPWSRQSGEEQAVSAEMEAEPANRRLGEIEMSREAAETARREKIAEQRERIREALGRMRAKIRASTETAAKVVAYRNGIRLQTIPGERREGDDVTQVVADELEDFWTVAGE
ncbi:MAG: hypothetical protein ACOCX2_01165 [Armatimonadota bacterium]